ncbi:hypothetical protein D3C86_2148910 [compost metagenome]
MLHRTLEIPIGDGEVKAVDGCRTNTNTQFACFRLGEADVGDLRSLAEVVECEDLHVVLLS